MPPVDSSAPTPAPEQPTPDQTPTPVPEQPKKPGFWARLFGGGKKEQAPAPLVPADHESQTPSPQLDIETDRNTIPTDPAVGENALPGSEGGQLPPAADSFAPTAGMPQPQGDSAAAPTDPSAPADPAANEPANTQPTNPTQQQ